MTSPETPTIDQDIQTNNSEQKVDSFTDLKEASMSVEQFEALGIADLASPEVADFMQSNGLSYGEDVIVHLDDGRMFVMGTSPDDFGTTSREMTEQLQDMTSASEQEVANTFAAENNAESSSEQVDSVYTGKVSREDIKRYKQITAARNAASAAYETVQEGGEVTERAPLTPQEKYNEAKQKLVGFIESSSVSDDDKYYLEEYAKAGDANYDRQGTIATKMSARAKGLAKDYQKLYDEKEHLRG